MNNKFNFYEVVCVKPKSGILDMSDLDTRKMDFQTLIGKKGVILGMADENDEWYYDVTLFDSEDSYMFRENDLVSTGETRDREEFYSGETVKVLVEPKTEEGSLVDADD